MNTITIDFEIGIRNSLIKNFHDARLKGCLFHYKNSLHRNLVKLVLNRVNQEKFQIRYYLFED